MNEQQLLAVAYIPPGPPNPERLAAFNFGICQLDKVGHHHCSHLPFCCQTCVAGRTIKGANK
jgi:hypothetical protein